MIKKGIILLLVTIMSATVCFGQEHRDNWRRPYADIGFNSTTMSSANIPDLMSNYGISFSVGRTFYLHCMPILGGVRLGIDATWFDLSYTDYQIMNMTYSNENRLMQYEQVEIAAQIGPSITIRPFGRFNIHGYIKYAPTISNLIANNKMMSCYSPHIVRGVSVSFGKIGFGVESRTFECRYKEIGAIDHPDNIENISYEGWRAFLTLVF